MTTKAVGPAAPKPIAATKAAQPAQTQNLNTAAAIAAQPTTTTQAPAGDWTLGNDIISTMLRNQTLLLEINQLQQKLASKSLDKIKGTAGENPVATTTADDLKVQQQTLESTRQQLLALKAQDVQKARQAIANVDVTLKALGAPASPTPAIANFPQLKTLK